MDFIRQWAVCLCAAALAAGVVNMLAPEGASKKILKTVVNVFVLCCILSPLAGWDGNINLNFSSRSEQMREKNAEALQCAVDKQVLAACESRVAAMAEENLAAAGIKTQRVTVNMDIGADNSIIINDLIVDLENAQDEAAAKETLRRQMGVKCRIAAQDNGGRDDE